MGYIPGTYADNLGVVIDGVVSVLSGYLFLCELKDTHLQDTSPRSFH